jgi:hypothetical protein
MYWRFTPVPVPCFSWPVSSSPAATYFLTWLIAAASSRETRLGNRCDRSPACSATGQPFHDGRSLTSADTYLLA